MASGVKVYCAGPLFNQKEREEMHGLANLLENSGFPTFLPQRDGLELTKCIEYLISSGVNPSQASLLMSKAIFALDVFQVLKGCDVVVANLNGRVPDEGTVSEAAIAWSRGKIVVGYKADSRTAFEGQDNPLVAGLFAFNLCSTFDEVLAKVKFETSRNLSSSQMVNERDALLSEFIGLGEQIWGALTRDRQIEAVMDLVQRQMASTEA